MRGQGSGVRGQGSGVRGQGSGVSGEYIYIPSPRLPVSPSSRLPVSPSPLLLALSIVVSSYGYTIDQTLTIKFTNFKKSLQLLRLFVTLVNRQT
jgi:hypothetical protein